MGFKEFKENLINKAAKSLISSGFTISSKEELDVFIKKSWNINFMDQETWEEKLFVKRCIVIFWDEKTDFFKNAVYRLPILLTKSFSQNIKIKLAKSSIKWLKLENYEIKKLPSMVVFENAKVLKVIQWEKNILKVVKETSLDINRTINSL